MSIAAALIYIYVRFKKIPLQVDRKMFLKFAVAGVIIALHWITFFGAIKAANVSITLAVMSTGAFFTALLEPIFYKRKLVWYELIFGLLVIGALYLIFDVDSSYHLGIGLALISALLSAVFTLINGKFAHLHNASKISFYELLVGAAFLLVFYAFAKAVSPTTISFEHAWKLTTSDWIYLGILASVCTAYAFIASVKVMKHLSPYTLMLTINLEPVYGIVLAYFILGDKEKMSSQFYYGAVIILLVVLANGILKNWATFNKKETI